MGAIARSGQRARRASPLGAAAAPVAALALAGLLSGCSTGYTRADFVSRADAICLGTVRQLRSFGSATAGGEQALAAYLERAAPVVRSEAKQIGALPRPPEGRRAAAERAAYIAALRRVAAGFGALAQDARSGDDSAVARVIANLRGNPVDALAARYGLRYCGTPRATVA